MIVVYQFEHLFPEKAIQCRQEALRSQRWKALGGNFLEKYSQTGSLTLGPDVFPLIVAQHQLRFRRIRPCPDALLLGASSRSRVSYWLIVRSALSS